MVLVIAGIFIVVNLLASFWNARAAGKVWKTTKIVGGYQRFMAWMVVSMSAAGFTWCFTTVIGYVAFRLHYLNVQNVDLLFNMGYVVIAPVILFAGYAITFDSWKRTIQQRSARNIGFTAWNTGASIYNTINVARFFEKAVKSVIDGFRKNPIAFLTLAIFLVAAFGGILATYGLVKHYAKDDRFAPVEASPYFGIQDSRPGIRGTGSRYDY